MPLHPHGAKRLKRERHVRHDLIRTGTGEDVISGRKRAFPTAGPLLHGSVPTRDHGPVGRGDGPSNLSGRVGQVFELGFEHGRKGAIGAKQALNGNRDALLERVVGVVEFSDGFTVHHQRPSHVDHGDGDRPYQHPA